MPPIAILVALADPTRCRLIEMLHAGPQPVHVLAAAFKISRPAISRHLRVLKQSGLISEKKFGRENRYALHAGKLAPVQKWLSGLLPVTKAPAAPKADIATSAAPVVETPKQPTESAAAPVAEAKSASTPKDVIAVKPGKPAKASKAPKAAELPSVSQMGFDF